VWGWLAHGLPGDPHKHLHNLAAAGLSAQRANDALLAARRQLPDRAPRGEPDQLVARQAVQPVVAEREAQRRPDAERGRGLLVLLESFDLKLKLPRRAGHQRTTATLCVLAEQLFRCRAAAA